MDLLNAALAGALAGYGVAIPVGAIAILIIEIAARRGPRIGAAAGLGAATADGLYATAAGLFGGAIAAALAPWSVALRWASVVVLVAIAVRGLRIALGTRQPPTPAAASGALAPGAPSATAVGRPDEGRSLRRTYVGFLGLTILNPMTVAYFAALVLGLPAVQGGVAERMVFAVAAFAASASWQLLLAAIGGLMHRHASPRAIRATSVVGNVVVLGFAGVIAFGLLTA